MNNRFLDAALGYIDAGLSVVILGKHDKLPTTAHTPNGLKDCTNDPNVARAWWELTPKCNVGIVCGKPSGNIVVIDVDTKKVDGYSNMRDWEMEHGDMPETVTCCTPTGGLHFYYKVDREVRPSVNEYIGIDIRGEGSLAVAPPSIHPKTLTEYTWEFSPEEHEIAEANDLVYQFIEYVRPVDENHDNGRREKVKMPRNGKKIYEGEGRNNWLYKQGCSLRGSRDDADDDFIAAWLTTLNDTYCRPSLPKSELEKIIKSVCKKPIGMSDEARANMSDQKRGRPRKFDHAAIGDKLITDNGACFIDGMPAIRHDGKYEVGWNAVSREIIALEKQATKANQREVHHYLTVLAPKMQQSRPTLIAFKNGVLDVDTMQLRKRQPDDVIPNIIPHDWIEDAECPEVDNVLLKMACGETDVLESLIEVMGVCMYRSSEFTQSAILLGEGSNGKSTYIRMLTALLGKENIASLDMAMIGKQFHTGHLAGKLANLGDDISNEFQRGDLLSIFKKVVDGNRIYTDVKGTEGFEFEPYATLVFSANEFPRLADYTDGMMRRIFPIEFNAKFSKTDADYDPRIAQKVTSERACQHMAYIGVMGLKQVIEHNGFTPNAASSRRVEEIRADNDTVLAWAIDNNWDTDALDGQYIPKLYEHYKSWCDVNGLQAVKRTKFTRGLNKHYGLESTVGWNNGKSEKCFQRKA